MNDLEDLRGKSYCNVITHGQISFNGTANMAKFRLKAILIVDRIRCKDPRADRLPQLLRKRVLQQ